MIDMKLAKAKLLGSKEAGNRDPKWPGEQRQGMTTPETNPMEWEMAYPESCALARGGAQRMPLLEMRSLD